MSSLLNFLIGLPTDPGAGPLTFFEKEPGDNTTREEAR